MKRHSVGRWLQALLVVSIAGLLVVQRAPRSDQSAQGVDRGRSSRILVVNPGTIAASVQVEAQGVAGSCAGENLSPGDPFDLGPGQLLVLDLATGAGGLKLPSDCAASASIRSNRPAVGVAVLDASEAEAGLSAYTGLSDASVSTTSVSPLPEYEGDDGPALSVLVQNTSDQSASFRLEPLSPEGRVVGNCGTDCVLRIAARASGRLRLDALEGVVSKELAALRLNSSAPAAALVEFGVGGHGDRDAFAASQGAQAFLPSDADAGEPAADAVPLLLRNAAFPSVGGDTLARNRIGPGRSEVFLQALGADFLSGVMEFHGLEPASVQRVPFGGSLRQRIALAEEATLVDGAFAGLLRLQVPTAAMVHSIWPEAGIAAYASASASQQIIVPFVARRAEGLSSWVSLQNPSGTLKATVDAAVYSAAGGRTPLAAFPVSIDPSSAATLDLDDDRLFLELGDDFVGWMSITSQTPIVAVGHVGRVEGALAVAAFEAIPQSDLSPTWWLPWLTSGWKGDREQATATPRPRPTETLLPTRPPTRVPTTRPSPDPSSGWERPIDERLGEIGRRTRRVARDADGALWARLATSNIRRDAIASVAPDGSMRSYRSLRAAVEGEYANIVQKGSLRGFWSVDARGMVWIGPRAYDGQNWTEFGADLEDAGGALTLDERVVLDEEGQAWVPQRGDAECERPQGCRVISLKRLSDGSALTLPPRPASAAPGVDDLHLLKGKKAQVLGGASRPEGADQAEEPVAFIVASDALYSLPDLAPIAYPELGPPPMDEPFTLRNAGHATASTVSPDGLVVVATWVELHARIGVRYALFLNTWDPDDAIWTASVNLSEQGGTSPLSSDIAASEQITALAYGPDGKLWIGTSGGRLLSWDGSAWPHVLRPGESPIAPGPISDLDVGADGKVVVGTSDGVLVFSPGSAPSPRRLYVPYAEQRR